jgi:hypothetical protein
VPTAGDEIDLVLPLPGGRAFAEGRLRDWIDAIEWPYAPEDEAGA